MSSMPSVLVKKSSQIKWGVVQAHKNEIKQKNKRTRFFWEHKDSVKKSYYDIYKAIFDVYRERIIFMRKWMSMVNTYNMFKRISLLCKERKKQIEYLHELKRGFFILWKESKDTREKIQTAKNKKNLALITRLAVSKFQIKRNLIDKHKRRIISLVFVSYYVNCNLNFHLKEFSLKCRFISQHS